MELIDSPQNRIPKLLRALHNKKGREEHGLALIEGPLLVAEALAYGRMAFVAVCPEVADPDQAENVANAAEKARVPIHVLSPRALAATSDTVSPTGIMGAAGIRAVPLAQVRLRKRGVYLVLCEVRDPGNAGTMVRTADAFGAEAIIAVGACVDLWEPKVIRASAGAVLRVPLCEASSDEFVAWARANGAATVAADMAGEIALPEMQWPLRVAILVGNEAHGLPADLAQVADARVRIPMPGRAESLNAAVAAGILLYAASLG